MNQLFVLPAQFNDPVEIYNLVVIILGHHTRPYRECPLSAAVLIYIANAMEPAKYPNLNTPAAEHFLYRAQSIFFDNAAQNNFDTAE